MEPNSMSKKSILITGCRRGIGHDAAIALARRGHHIIAATRTNEQAEQLEQELQNLGLEITCTKLDLLDADDIQKVSEWKPDIVVLNAAANESGPLALIPRKKVEDIFNVNVFGNLDLAQVAIKTMCDHETDGRLIFVSSIAGKIAVPYLGPYVMTKFALEAAADTLRRELHNNRIRVSIIEPGKIATGFNEDMDQQKYAWLPESVMSKEDKEEMHRREKSLTSGQSSTRGVVKAIIHAVESTHPKTRYIAPWQYKPMVHLLRFLPDKFIDRLLAFMVAALVLGSFAPTNAHAQTLASQLSGRVLLAVQDHGKTWYVNPSNHLRYYLRSPADVRTVIEQTALGISNSNLNRIASSSSLQSQLSGRILLQVESHGEAWYVDPVSRRAIALGSVSNALSVLQKSALGITNANLSLITEAAYAETPTSSSLLNIAFTSQAPAGDWDDTRQQEGCEEASVIMAVKWARNEPLTSSEAETLIKEMSDWENKTFGSYYDTSVADTASRLFEGYFNFHNIEVKQNIDADDIISSVNTSHPVLVAVDGQKLDNPNFIGGGPLRHMILIVGYDAAKNEFITHDPGTQYGKNYRYAKTTIQNALRDYPSGNHAPLTPMPTSMIVVTK